MTAPSKSTTQKPVPNGVAAPPDISTPAEPPVNRKRQKKKQKQAARLAAAQSASQSSSETRSNIPNGQAAYSSHAYRPSDLEPVSPIEDYSHNNHTDAYGLQDGEDRFYATEDRHE